jgi:predicted acyl esterase
MSNVPTPFLTATGTEPPTQYDRVPEFDGFIEERDVSAPMRDRVNLSVDVYRPDTTLKLPAARLRHLQQGPAGTETSLMP